MAMKQFYTYLHCKPDGTPFYVGKGGGHRGRRSHNFADRSQHHKNIVAKYGKANIRIFVFNCESEEQAFADEIQQIAQLRREGHELCNVADGGQGASGVIKSPETCAKLSLANKDRRHTDASKLNMSLAHIGKNCGAEHHMFGKHHTPESCAKIQAARAKQIFSEYSIAKMTAKSTGRVRTAASKHKTSVSVTESWRIRKALSNGV